ncbi:hypothetical protein TTRE_0000700301 [Trichuris trichiura]|uniref:Uncharacterized protein n=1 Tax=Trichuris trichiura TaxID=36087 RepID=A0A077ZGF0_TRITR|nr:hypothetical protein TTRE_0000700301 [Trichuris trichiura]
MSIVSDKTKDKKRIDLLEEAEMLTWKDTRSATVQETKIPLGNFDRHDEITSEQPNSTFIINQTGENGPLNKNATLATTDVPTSFGDTSSETAPKLQNKSYYNYAIPHSTNEKSESAEKSTSFSEANVGDTDSNKNVKGPGRAVDSNLDDATYSVFNVSYGSELSEQESVSSTVGLLSFNITAYDTQHVVNFTLSNEKGKGNEMFSALVANSSQPPIKITSTAENTRTGAKETLYLEGADHKTAFERENSSKEFGVHQMPKVNKGGVGVLHSNSTEKQESWFKHSIGYLVCAASFVLVYACLLLSTAAIKQCKHKNKREKLIADRKNHNGTKVDSQKDQAQIKDKRDGIQSSSANFDNDVERYNASCHISQSSQNSQVLTSAVNRRLTVFRKRDDSLYLHDDFITGMLNSSNSSNSGESHQILCQEKESVSHLMLCHAPKLKGTFHDSADDIARVLGQKYYDFDHVGLNLCLAVDLMLCT